MRWIVLIVVGVTVFWVWLLFGSEQHCPQCGIELPDDWAAPGSKRQRCPCGWTG